MSKFYASDENGISKNYHQERDAMGFGGSVTIYKGKENGRYKYTIDTSENTESYSGSYDPYGVERLKNQLNNRTLKFISKMAKQRGAVYIFSTDFNKLNVSPYLSRSEGGVYDNLVDVYERYVPDASSSRFYE